MLPLNAFHPLFSPAHALIRRVRLHRSLLGALALAACSDQPMAVRPTLDAGGQATAGLVVTPVNRGLTAAQGGPAPATVKVTVSATTGSLSGLSVGTIGYGGGQPSGWLTTASLSGTTTPATLTLGVTPGSLPVGTYNATIPVTASGASNNPQVAKVTLTVVAGPWITATPTLRNFVGTVGGVSPAAKTIDVSNSGTVGSSLTGLSVSGVAYGAGQPSGWLTTATLNATTAPAILTLRPTVGALGAGTYTATVSIASPVAVKSPITVSVKFTISVPTTPLIALSPVSRGFTAPSGGSAPAAKTVSITNTGTGTLSGLAVGAINYLGGPTGWLTTATLNSATAPATLTVQASPGVLPAGNYTAKVPITSAVAGNSPQNVTVTMTVTPAAPFILFERYSGALAFFPVTGEVWRMDPAGGHQVQLTTDATFDGEPDLSPDRQSIVFSSSRNGGPHLYRMLADGSGVTQLTVSPTISVQDQRHGRWSASGQSVIYQDRVQTGMIGHYDLRMVAASAVSDTGVPLRIGTINSEEPDWSPAGLDFVWAESNTINSSHLIYRTVPNGLIALTSGANATEPDWSPDSLRVVFTQFTNPADQIWVMDAANGANAIQLTFNGANFSPHWSPDGGKIVFTRYDGSQYDIWAMDADGSNQVNLTNTPGSHETYASWR